MRTNADRQLDWDTGRELERKDAEINRLRAKLWKVVGWLDRLAMDAEERAQDRRFLSLAEANAADAKNYRATIADIKSVLPANRPKARLSESQLSTLREMASYSSPYHFRQATCRTLVQLGLAEPIGSRKRPPHRITSAGREALQQTLGV